MKLGPYSEKSQISKYRIPKSLIFTFLKLDHCTDRQVIKVFLPGRIVTSIDSISSPEEAP